MLKRITVALILLVAAPIAAANAQGFIVGMAVGGMLFGGGNNQYGSAGATIIFTAPEEILKATDPLSVRQVASRTCFNDNNTPHWRASHKSLGEIFGDLTKERPPKDRTILQIIRVFEQTQSCGSIWFVYTEK